MTLIAVEIDATTGESIERPFTEEEIAQRAADEAAAQAAEAAKAELQALIASARAKVAEASGLTPEEMAALGF